MSEGSRPKPGDAEALLWDLVAERTRPGADLEAIDRRIWSLFGEEWAVMFTDLSGFSRRVAAFGIIHFLQIIHEHKSLLLPLVTRHGGTLLKLEADSFLILFRSPSEAVRCAVEMQQACQRHSESRKPEEQVLLCVGIGYGPVLRVADRDVWGQEVNAASKLGEDVARSHEILITGATRAALGELSGFELERIDASVAGTDATYRVLYEPWRAGEPNAVRRVPGGPDVP